jgi:hypothetical protein
MSDCETQGHKMSDTDDGHCVVCGMTSTEINTQKNVELQVQFNCAVSLLNDCLEELRCCQDDGFADGREERKDLIRRIRTWLKD